MIIYQFNNLTIIINQPKTTIQSSKIMRSRFQINHTDPKHVNTDLQLINHFLTTQQDQHFQPKNTRQLAIALKNKVAIQHATKDQKKKCQEWLKEKGLKMETIIDYLKDKKKEKQQENSQITLASQLTKNIKIYPTLWNQQTFLINQIQHITNHQLCHLPTTRKIKIKLHNKILSRFNDGQSERKKGSKIYSRIFDQQYSRNQKKIRQYMQLVINLTQKQRRLKKQFKPREWVQSFCDNMDHKLWKIISHQLKNVDFTKDKGDSMQMLIINSLHLIKSQFNEELPINLEGISYYLQEKYLSKFQQHGEYVLDPQEGCFWGKAFLYFRAGRYQKLKNLLHKLNEGSMMQQIRISEESIKEYRPQKTKKQELKKKFLKEKDVFRQQIIYTLTGENKYSSNILSNPFTLDCLWIFLRTTGIYYQTNYKQFQEIRRQMIAFYKENIPISERIYLLAYLIDYDGILELQCNDVLDKDDYLHLLILLNHYPLLSDQRQLLYKRLTQAITSFLIEYSSNSVDQIPLAIESYLLQLPKEVFIEQASSIIIENKMYETIEWDYFKDHFEYKKDQGEYYQAFLMATTQKYVDNTSKYLQGAESFLKRTKTNNIRHICSTLDMIVSMLIRHANNTKIYNGNEIKRGLEIMREEIRRSEQVEKRYLLLLNLFENQRTITKHLIDRNFSEIHKFLMKEKTILFLNHLDYNKLCMIQKLIQLKGIDAFFIYMRNLIKASDYFYSSEDNDHNGTSYPFQELKKYHYEILKTCKAISNHENFPFIAKEPSFISLLKEIQGKIYEY